MLLDGNYPSEVHSMLVSHIKRYLHISLAHYLLTHIQIDVIGYYEIGTNDNLAHNIDKNKEVAYADDGYSHLHLH